MVNRALSLTIALTAALPVLAGCTAEFGGRCATADECDEDRICLQGYCLPPEAAEDAGPDGGEPPSDGGEPPADGGEPPELGLARATCDPPTGPVPAYDDALRPCVDDATIALWRFDDDFEAAVPPDSDPLTRSGDVSGDRVRIDGGVFGGAAVFDGGGDPNLDLDSAVRAEGPMTVELWLRIPSEGQAFRGVLGNLQQRGGETGGFEIFVNESDGAYRLGFGWRSDRFHETDARFPADTWTHLAATLDASNALVLYVDGQPQRFDPIPLGDTPRGLRFGRGIRTFLGDRPFPGAIDEVRISSVARDPATLARVAEGVTRPE